MDDLMKNVDDWQDEDKITAYINSVISREAFDRSGTVYGMGHPVYSLSDPRAQMLKVYAKDLAVQTGLEKEYNLYCLVEQLAVKAITKRARIYKGVCANIDFYSAFVYTMLGLPGELFTPLFAVARSVGWTAHRIEELAGGGKIIRPSYQSVCGFKDYIPLEER